MRRECRWLDASSDDDVFLTRPSVWVRPALIYTKTLGEMPRTSYASSVAPNHPDYFRAESDRPMGCFAHSERTKAAMFAMVKAPRRGCVPFAYFVSEPSTKTGQAGQSSAPPAGARTLSGQWAPATNAGRGPDQHQPWAESPHQTPGRSSATAPKPHVPTSGVGKLADMPIAPGSRIPSLRALKCGGGCVWPAEQ
jgi:hypothetical protein